MFRIGFANGNFGSGFNASFPGFEQRRFGGGNVNPGFEDVFAHFLEHMGAGPDAAFFGAGFPQEETEHKQPPTAQATLQSMPIVKVTEHDINDKEECTICFDKLAVGDNALRIPCGHLFHEDCVRTWLTNSNQCPVCRYELPTDSVDFENGRRERMMNRRPRLTVEDLSVKSVKELRFLAQHLSVQIAGCLEKSDVVDAIIESGRVEIIPVAPEPCVAAAAQDPAENSRPCSEASAMLAIADGEPIIESFLGNKHSLMALSKKPLSSSTGFRGQASELASPELQAAGLSKPETDSC